jgi:hypothetical protein
MSFEKSIAGRSNLNPFAQQQQHPHQQADVMQALMYRYRLDQQCVTAVPCFPSFIWCPCSHVPDRSILPMKLHLPEVSSMLQKKA